MSNAGDGNSRFVTTNDRAHTQLVDEPSIGELFKKLGNDTSHLLRQEINLARTELKETGERIRTAAVQIAIAAVIGIAGALALVAFLVVALGDYIGNYWIAALTVAVLMIAIAAVMVNRAIAGLTRHPVGIPKTAETLRDDARWAKEEAREFKRELTA